MNLISDELRVLYIHIPKNGGHTICPLLRRKCRKVRMPVNKRVISRNDLKRYYIFTIVRNPYDRYLSGWKNMIYLKNRENIKLITPEYFQKNYILPPSSTSDIHVHWTQTKHLAYVFDDLNDAFRFEEFDLAYETIDKKFNCNGQYPPPRNLKTLKETNTMDYLNDEVIQYINKKFHDDFEKLKYKKL